MRKKILLYTRPLSAPWDEASKNLAYDIIRKAQGDFEFRALCAKNQIPKEFSEEDSEEDIKDENEIGKKINSEEIYSTNNFGFLSHLQLLKRLYKFPLKTDVIHFAFTPRQLTSFLIKLRLLFSKVRTIQTVATIRDEAFEKICCLKKILFADKIVVQSETTRKRLLAFEISNTETIYPGIDLEKFCPAPKDIELMNQLGIKEDDFVLMYAGEYTRIRGIDDILDAFEKILKENPERKNIFKLIIACRLKSKEDKLKKIEVMERIKKSDLDKNVVFIDAFSNMPVLFNLTDLNLFPVREMSGKCDIPYVIIEAMACEKPMIVSKLAVLEELIENNENGIVVEKANPQMLAETIVDLYQNVEKRQALAKNGLEFVRENFDIDKNIRSYEEIYRNI